jgi:VanZ family protein
LKSRAYWILTGLYCAFIFTLTHLPPGAVHPPTGRDKIYHTSVYGMLAILLFATLQASGWTIRQAFISVLGIGMVYGIVDELTQPLFRRSAEIADWFADVIGLLLGLAICLAVGAISRKKDASHD